MDNRKTKKKMEERRKKHKENSDGQNKIMVTIPYMREVSGAVEHTPRRHGIATAVRPYKTLRQLRVHRKDKRSVHESAGIAYSIPYRDCLMVYIGETGRRFEMRERVKKDLKPLEGLKYTRGKRSRRI